MFWVVVGNIGLRIYEAADRRRDRDWVDVNRHIILGGIKRNFKEEDYL